VLWRSIADDDSIFVADPDPDHHLAVWLDGFPRQGYAPWSWHVLDSDGDLVARAYTTTRERAQAAAESAYAELVGNGAARA
jgi:hypothetical protein